MMIMLHHSSLLINVPSMIMLVSILTLCLVIASSQQSTTSPNGVQAASAEKFVCDSEDKLVTDVWSINNVFYIRLLHYKNDSTNDIDCRIFVYDVQQNKFINVIHSPSMASVLYADTSSNFLKDIIGKELSKASANNVSQTPSIVYFNTRNVLRYHCQTKWLYVPPSSQFCRFHPIVNYLFRVVAVIDQTSINSPNRAKVELYRMINIRSDDFPMTIIRPIFSSFRNDHKRDVLEQYITTSILTLQVNHHIIPPPHQNVRFIFSNNLGLFISWYPSTFANFENDQPVNCAVMIPIKNKPYIRVCSQRYNFVSFIESNETLYVVLPENQIIPLEHEYIKKQYRIMNNLLIDLDKMEPVNFFQTFFKCSEAPPSSKLYKYSLQFYRNTNNTKQGDKDYKQNSNIENINLNKTLSKY